MTPKLNNFVMFKILSGTQTKDETVEFWNSYTATGKTKNKAFKIETRKENEKTKVVGHDLFKMFFDTT